MLNETLLAALGEILPPSALLTAAEDTRPYECDGLTLYRAQPLAVLLPENEAQVVEILKICNAARLPVVARGAGTGLSGGATPNNDGVVLSLAKFKRIIAIGGWQAPIGTGGKSDHESRRNIRQDRGGRARA